MDTNRTLAFSALIGVLVAGCAGAEPAQTTSAETIASTDPGPSAEDGLHVAWSFLSQSERRAFCYDFQRPEGRAELYRSFVSGAGGGSPAVTIGEFNAFFFPRC
jgi:hypothetical protein